VRVFFLLQAEAGETLPHFAGQRAEVVGTVVNDPDRRATSLHVNIEVESIDGREEKGTLLALLPRDVQLDYGDHVKVSGVIALPQPFDTDTGRQFDYAGYLRAQGVSATMQRANIDEVVQGGWSLKKSLFDVKHIFENAVERVVPEPQSSLLEGLLIGEKRGLPDEINKAFIASGLVHVVVLSGYNISIVAEAILRATSFLPPVFNYSLGAVLMILFAIMSGSGAATIRALLMGLVAILARYLKRPADALRALIFAACAMALWNPHVILHDPGFMLSVLATFGLITISPTTEKYLKWMPEKFGVRSIAASTLSVQLFVLPALLYQTGMLSFLALPANVLALPVVPFAMLTGFLAGMLALIPPRSCVPVHIHCRPFTQMDVLRSANRRNTPVFFKGNNRLPRVDSDTFLYPTHCRCTLFIYEDYCKAANASRQRSS
jgi:competence protein ComEC